LKNISIISGKTTEEMARKISRRLGANFVRSKIRVFPDGESKITLSGEISKKRSVVVQSIFPPVDTNLIHALSLITKAKEESSKVTAVIPYMGYARQDREFLPGEIVTMKVLAKLFRGAGASEIMAVDVHSMVGFKHFKIRARNVSAIPDLVRYFKKMKLKEPLVVSPDQGGKERAAKFARELGTEFIALEKKRDRKSGKVRIETRKASKVLGTDLILVDDMISTGGSIVKAVQFLKKQKCRRIFVACTHALLINGAEGKIRRAGVSKIVSTNTVPGRTSIVDVSGSIAGAIAVPSRNRLSRF